MPSVRNESAVFVFVYTHTHTHTHMYVYVYMCVCVCMYIRACINLGGLCNEALGISDCVTLIRCLVNDELERMWKEVVVA